MSRRRREFDPEFCEGAVRVVKEAGGPVAHVAGELGVDEGALGNWVRWDQAERAGGLTAGERAGLARLRKRVAELEMGRGVLKRSVVLWVGGATR